jgi:hypothetical protein
MEAKNDYERFLFIAALGNERSTAFLHAHIRNKTCQQRVTHETTNQTDHINENRYVEHLVPSILYIGSKQLRLV